MGAEHNPRKEIDTPTQPAVSPKRAQTSKAPAASQKSSWVSERLGDFWGKAFRNQSYWILGSIQAYRRSTPILMVVKVAATRMTPP